MSPEVITRQPHGRKVDCWSLGCCVIEMFSGRPPWQQFKTQISALYHIGSTSDPPEMPDNMSADAKDFCLFCLERDPKKRPNVLRLLEHPFITEPYTGPATKVRLPAPERTKRSANTEEGAEETTANTTTTTSPGASATASVDQAALLPEQADGLEDEIAEYLRKQQADLKNSSTIEQIKIKL